MLSLGPLAFASPWILLALLSLPLLWYLLRVTPPSPRRQRFPAMRLLLGLRPSEETPARTPWWLLLLRLAIAALVILALAQPLLNPTQPLRGSGPLVLVLDDGWAAARGWERRLEAADGLLEQAQRSGRPVVLLTTAPEAAAPPAGEGRALPQQSAAELRRSLQVLAPKPWPVDRAALVERLGDARFAGAAEVYWLSDGLDAPGSRALAERLRRLGPVTLLRDPPEMLPRLLLPPESEGLDLLLRVRRVAGGFPETLVLRADDEEGYEVATTELAFEPEAREAVHRLTLPLELRNRIERLTIEAEQGAGAVLLLDERWRRRPVGLVTVGAADGAQPLLEEHYYLERALEPFTEIYRDSLDGLLRRNTAVLVLADTLLAGAEQEERLRSWVEGGGLLLRFAGPRLLEAPADGLLPVRLRAGGRTLGGAMAWDRPAGLAPFPDQGPFAGLALPDDVEVRRQVLAEPSLDLADRTWARLEDGTPLVTAERLGEGWSVLVHTTANVEWSDLALSGLFVEMLQRLVALSQGVTGSGQEPLPPLRLLDGFGRLVPPTPAVLPLPPAGEEAALLGPRNPPGVYGSALSRRALNLAPALDTPRPLPAALPGLSEAFYGADRERSLLPWLLTAALLLALGDLLLGLLLRGLLPGLLRRRRRPATLALLLAGGLAFAALGPPATAAAQEPGAAVGDDAFALSAVEETRLAYLVTGVPAVDETSRAGLHGLSQMLIRRTTVEPAEPVGLRPGRDELAFFPLIYWPITSGQRDLDEPALAALNDFLEHGGTLVIDLLRPDALGGFGRGGSGEETLRRLTGGLLMPPLEPVPPDHVLTKAFYLLQEFPGRYAGGALWVEETEERRHDGVATVILGANDWAAAWAVDELGRPLAAVVPGGERQREMAFRFGINLVMYALTGNYKADQVHVPFILERLGQ